MEQERSLLASRRLVVAAISLASLPMGATAVASILPGLGSRVLIVGACTALISGLAARSALRRSVDPCATAGAVFFLSVMAAILNAPLSYVAIALSEGDGEALLFIPIGVVFTTLFGAIVTVPLGLLFGSLSAALVSVVARPCQKAAHESRDQVVRAVGSWLSLVGLATLSAQLLLVEGALPQDTAGLLVLFTGTVIGLGLGSSMAAHSHLLARRYWLAQVRRGELDGWTLAPIEEFDDSTLAQLRPLLLRDDPPESVLLRRRGEVGSGAYRSGEHLEPVALV